MFAVDWIVLGVTELVLAIVVASAVAAFLAWRMPMAPLAPAIVAGGSAAGLVLLFGGVYPAIVLLAGGWAAALAGFLYDRAVIGQARLAVAEIVIAGATVAFCVPLLALRANAGIDVPRPLLLAAIAIVVALFSLWLRRTDRLPGFPAAVGAFVAAVGTFLAVWRGVPQTQSIWWLGTLALLLVGFSVVSRSRAAPFAAAGTSYVALMITVLVMAIAAQAGLAVRF